jgi:hypothetical protein
MLEAKNLDHTFTVEMKSKRHVKSISISDETPDRVLFEGNLGALQDLSLVEGDVLEIIGVNGVLRINLTKTQLQETIENASKPSLGADEGR